MKLHEEKGWSLFKKSKPKKELTLGEKRRDELIKLSDIVENIKSSDIDELKFTGDIPEGTPDKGRFWWGYSEVKIKFKRRFIENSLDMRKSDLDLKGIIGDHQIEGDCLWSDDDKHIKFILFKVRINLNGEFRDCGSYSRERIHKSYRGDDYYLSFEISSDRDDEETLEEYIKKSLYSLNYNLTRRLRGIDRILKKSIEKLEKDKRKEELEKRIGPVSECFYELIDMSYEHNIFINQADGMTCVFGIRDIEIVKHGKSDHIRLNDKLTSILNILMEAKPRINDIVDGATFDVKFENRKITLIIS